jgi:Protein of unknown function (DUF3047)
MIRMLTGLLCATVVMSATAQQAPDVPRFSTMKPTGAAPQEWKPFALSSTKKNTDYTLVADDGVTVLRASAHGAASAMAYKTEFDPRQFPMLSWRWKVVQGIPDANNAEVSKEDSPVRVMISFDGDASKLSVKDKFASSFAQSQSGHPLPYATLMYIWGNKVPINKVTTSGRTSRIRMLALNVDDQGIGKWHSFTRNLVEDYKLAFGEEPGKVTGIQLLTDTDNTGGDADALYGDISVGPPRP